MGPWRECGQRGARQSVSAAPTPGHLPPPPPATPAPHLDLRVSPSEFTGSFTQHCVLGSTSEAARDLVCRGHRSPGTCRACPRSPACRGGSGQGSGLGSAHPLPSLLPWTWITGQTTGQPEAGEDLGCPPPPPNLRPTPVPSDICMLVDPNAWGDADGGSCSDPHILR